MMKQDRSTGQFPFAINSGQRAEMETVEVSPEFKMVIPKRIRAAVERSPARNCSSMSSTGPSGCNALSNTPARSRSCAASPKVCSGKMIIVTAATASKLVVPGLTTL
jgi:hypothetical protein